MNNSRLTATAPIVGMAALWISVFKQLLYPVLYAYYRTGDESALVAQTVYSVTLVAVAFGLLVAHARLSKLAGKRRWIVVAFGVGGALGIALRTLSSPAIEAGEIAMCFGAVLSAAYLPVHFAFWALYARHLDRNDTTRTVALSFVVFLVVYGMLTATGANTVYASIACPIVSAAMALACPKWDGESFENANEKLAVASEDATAKSAAHKTAFEPEAVLEAAPVADYEITSAPTNANAPAVATEAATEAMPTPTPASAGVAQAAPAPAPAPTAPILPAGFATAFDLSEREAELAAYAHRNWSARRIAGELFIAESTVYTHLKRIYRKTDVHSKHELIDLIDTWQHES